MEDKEFYYGLYSKKLVDNAESYFKEDYSLTPAKMGAMIELTNIVCQDKENDERGKHFLEVIMPTLMFAYLHGARENAGMSLEEMEPNLEDSYSDYRKNKDFCVFFDFKDNDFGEHIRAGAEMYVDRYNHVMGIIDSYIADGIDISKSSYVEDIKRLEDLEKIKKTIAYGVMSESIKSYSDYALIFPEKEMKDPLDVSQEAYSRIDYLGINNDSNYKVGTYSEVEKWVVDRYKRKDDDNLQTIWMNGEALIIAVIDGEMKYSIR
jgi:predicted DNA-binding protein YlxM (UPF0122 family)